MTTDGERRSGIARTTLRSAIVFVALLLSGSARAQLHDCSYCEQAAARTRQMAAQSRANQRALGGASAAGTFGGTYAAEAATAEQAAQRYDAEARACRAGRVGPYHVCGPTTSAGAAGGTGGAGMMGRPGGARVSGSVSGPPAAPSSEALINEITAAVQGLDRSQYSGGTSAQSLGLREQNLDDSSANPDQCPAGQVVIEIDFPGGVKCGPWPPPVPPELDFGSTPPRADTAAAAQSVSGDASQTSSLPPASVLDIPTPPQAVLGTSISTAGTAPVAAPSDTTASPPATNGGHSGNSRVRDALTDDETINKVIDQSHASEEAKENAKAAVEANGKARDCFSESFDSGRDNGCVEHLGADVWQKLLPKDVQNATERLNRAAKVVTTVKSFGTAIYNKVASCQSLYCAGTRRWIGKLMGRSDDE